METSTDWDHRVYPRDSPASCTRDMILKHQIAGSSLTDARIMGKSDIVNDSLLASGNNKKWFRLAISYCNYPMVGLLSIICFHNTRRFFLTLFKV